MTVKSNDGFNKIIYHCDICGRQDFWSESWWWYGSIALMETSPKDIPTACNDDCMKKLEDKIKKGNINGLV